MAPWASLTPLEGTWTFLLTYPPHVSLGELGGPGHRWTWLCLCVSSSYHLVQGLPSRLTWLLLPCPRPPCPGPSCSPGPAAPVGKGQAVSPASVVPARWWAVE